MPDFSTHIRKVVALTTILSVVLGLVMSMTMFAEAGETSVSHVPDVSLHLHDDEGQKDGTLHIHVAGHCHQSCDWPAMTLTDVSSHTLFVAIQWAVTETSPSVRGFEPPHRPPRSVA